MAPLPSRPTDDLELLEMEQLLHPDDKYFAAGSGGGANNSEEEEEKEKEGRFKFEESRPIDGNYSSASSSSSAENDDEELGGDEDYGTVNWRKIGRGKGSWVFGAVALVVLGSLVGSFVGYVASGLGVGVGSSGGAEGICSPEAYSREFLLVFLFRSLEI